MAITRTQIARQLYQAGGGADFGAPDKAEERASKGYGNPSGGKAASKGFDQKAPSGGGDNNNNIVDEVALTGGKKIKTPPKKPKKTKDNTLPTLNTAERFRVFNLKKLYDRKMGLTPNIYGVIPNLAQAVTPNKLQFYEESDPMFDATYYGMSGEDITDADRLAKAINEAEKTGNITQTQFEDAFFGPDGPPQIVNRDDTPMDPCKGPNPPAYCFIGDKADETQEAAVTRNLAGLTPRIGGGMFNFDNMADGGIADMDREAFLLGGIAKGLKKAVRGVKKLAKSPIGKAAILGAVGFGLGGKGAIGSFFGKGSFNPFLRKVAGDTAFSGLGSILSKAGLVNKAGSLTALGMIGVPTVASLFMKPKEDENDELAKYLASQKLEPSQSIRGMGSEFDFYGGERMRVADGGDVEPVAKKTMPLLDMGGKEKDYRETGGFVDMGRMERADDVPARLSKNEFVFTADAVRNAGEGDIDKGAEVMYNMMKNLEAGGEVSEESQGLEGAREMFQTSQRLGEVI